VNPSQSSIEPRGFKTDAAVVEDLARRLHEFEVVDISRPVEGKAIFAVVPEGKKLHDLKPFLDAYLPRPERRKGTARLFSLAAFIAFVERYNTAAGSVVFAKPDKTAPSLTAVFNYHEKGAGQADWLDHRAIYAPELSEEWKAWRENDGELMTQGDFAAFIEDAIRDVVVPDASDERLAKFADLVQGRWALPSELVALSRNLSVNVETAVRNAVTLNTGEITVLYSEQHRDGESGDPIRIANLFQIVVPVFYAGAPYRVAVRLRYRLISGKVHWMYQMVRPDLAFDDAFNGMVTQVNEDVAAEVVLGSPEA